MRERGRGSHATVYFGDRLAVVPSLAHELKTGTLRGILRQLGIGLDELKGRTMTRDYSYPVILTPGEEAGGYVVTCADLPEVVTQGDDRAHALEQAADAIEEAVAGRLRRGEEIPVPHGRTAAGASVPLPPVMAAKTALAQAMRQAGMSRVTLAGRLGCDEKEVRRLLDPRHPSKMPRLERALKALGKGLVVRVVDRVA